MSHLTRSKPESERSQKTGDAAKGDDTSAKELATSRDESAHTGPLEIELEVSRNRAASWTVFGVIVGVLPVLRLGTMGQWAGVVLIAIGLYRAFQLVQSFMYRPGTIVVSDKEVVLPRGLCLPKPLTVEPSAVTAVYFLRRSVPWNRSAPVLVVELGPRAIVPARLVRVGGRPAPRRARATRASQAVGEQRLVIRVAIAAALLATPAAADRVNLPHTKATFELSAEWHPVVAPGVVAAYRTDAGAMLAITRAQMPNPDAWRTRTREAYIDQIERGIKERIAGYRRVSRRFGRVRDVPTLDLVATRHGGATVVFRILLFPSYALALAIEVPAGSDVGAPRAVATGFGP
jgi:hypothetical protein